MRFTVYLLLHFDEKSESWLLLLQRQVQRFPDDRELQLDSTSLKLKCPAGAGASTAAVNYEVRSLAAGTQMILLFLRENQTRCVGRRKPTGDAASQGKSTQSRL